MASLLIKQLDQEILSELQLYPVENVTLNTEISQLKDLIDQKKHIEVTHDNDFSHGAMSAIYRNFYDGNLSDYQQYRHGCLRLAFSNSKSLTGTIFSFVNPMNIANTLIKNDMKNKNENAYLLGKIWGNEYLKRKI